jgi:hypothetical protein
MEKSTDILGKENKECAQTSVKPDTIRSDFTTKKSLSASKANTSESKTKFQDITYVRRKPVSDDIMLVQKYGGNLTEIDGANAKKFGDLVKTMVQEKQDNRLGTRKGKLPVIGVTSLGPSEHIDPLNLTPTVSLMDQFSESKSEHGIEHSDEGNSKLCS